MKSFADTVLSRQHFLFSGLTLLVVLAVIVRFCLAPAPALAAAVTNGPMDAVTIAQKAVDAADPDMFAEVVDVDSVLNKGITTAMEIMKEQSAQNKAGQGSPLLALALAGLSGKDKNQVELIKALLVSEVKGFVRTGIYGGYFAGKPNGRAASNSSTFSPLLDGVSKKRKELLPGKVLSQQKDAASVSATLVDKDAGNFPLSLGLERQNGVWRVTELRNLRELMRKAQQ